MKSNRVALVVMAMVASTVPAQLSICDGNGGQGKLALTTPAWLGPPTTLTVTGAANAPFLVASSDAAALNFVPGLGTVCLAFDPSLRVAWSGQLSPIGRADLTASVPDLPFWQSFVAFMQGAVADPALPGGAALTNTVLVDFETTDSYASVGSMAVARASATASLLPTGHVLLTGGSSWSGVDPLASTEIYHPLARQFTAGPLMSTPRRHHTATTLLDGRVLVVGGFTGYPNTVTSACEVFDPSNGAFLPAAPLPAPRAGHVAARLPDGRVLVAGGSTSVYYGGSGGTGISTSGGVWFDWYAAGSTVTASAFVYDPSTDQWTPAGSLQAPRFLAQATTLADGRPMIIGGLDGLAQVPGQMGFPIIVPHYGGLVDVFDPASSSFQTFPSAPAGLIGHRVSTVPSGDVVVTGGFWIRKFDGTSWTSFGGIAPGGDASFHGQAVLPNGQVHVSGVKGITSFPSYAWNLCFRTAGGIPTLTASVPLAPGQDTIKHHAEIALMDGTILIAGGEDALSGDPSPTTLASAWLYIPAP